MTTQPKTTADVIISAIAEWKDGKIYWEDCTAIIKANLSALSSELSALQKENAELRDELGSYKKDAALAVDALAKLKMSSDSIVSEVLELRALVNNKHTLRRCRELHQELDSMQAQRDVAIGLMNGDDIPDETVSKILSKGTVTERWYANRIKSENTSLRTQNRELREALEYIKRKHAEGYISFCGMPHERVIDKALDQEPD